MGSVPKELITQDRLGRTRNSAVPFGAFRLQRPRRLSLKAVRPKAGHRTRFALKTGPVPCIPKIQDPRTSR